jgi:hypothetical protein
MNKKGVEAETSTLRQIIFFAIICLLIALPACVRLYNFWTAKPSSGTTKSVDAIRIEINNLYDEQEVPVFVDENHVIMIFNAENAEKPQFGECKKFSDKSCICVCREPSCDVDKNEVKLCKVFDGDYFDDSHPIPPKIVEEKARMQNCVFVKDEGIVSLTGCS